MLSLVPRFYFGSIGTFFMKIANANWMRYDADSISFICPHRCTRKYALYSVCENAITTHSQDFRFHWRRSNANNKASKPHSNTGICPSNGFFFLSSAVFILTDIIITCCSFCPMRCRTKQTCSRENSIV